MTTRPTHALPALAFTLLLGAGFLAACDRGEQTEQMSEAMPASQGDSTPATTAADTGSVQVRDVGLETPESVLYDSATDLYLVSNINGPPVAHDDNGFIARFRPDGTVDQLRWIDAAASNTVTLNGPKGLALKGDTLFVADIDTVRAFDRNTGEPLADWGVPGATFLNDVAIGDDGTVYVTDSGLNADFSSSGTDAVYRFENGQPVAVVKSTDLKSPNGITASDGELYVVSFGGPDVMRIDPSSGQFQVVGTLPWGQLDGVVRLPDGSLLVSSWEGSEVFRARPGQPADSAQVVVPDVTSPADIGFDTRRQRVLVPVFNEDRLVFWPLK